MRTLGIVLVALGVLALLYTGFSFNTKETVAKVGPLELKKEKEKTVTWPPVVGGILLIGGIVLLLKGKK
jgi:LPXTG-motif cell wall-anchored protein